MNMQELQSKAKTLIEALPYIQRFSGKNPLFKVVCLSTILRVAVGLCVF